MEKMEKRRNIRLPVTLTGQLSGGRLKARTVETRNLSLTGARLDLVPLESEIEGDCILTLFLPTDEMRCVSVRCRTHYSDGASCGLAFLSIDQHDFALLSDYLESEIDDPAVIRREIKQGHVPMMESWAVL